MVRNPELAPGNKLKCAADFQQWDCIRFRHACTFKEFQNDVFPRKPKSSCLHEINYVEFKYKSAGSVIHFQSVPETSSHTELGCLE